MRLAADDRIKTSVTNHIRQRRNTVNRILRFSLAAAMLLLPSLSYAQYDGYWRNAVFSYNVPDFRVGGGQVTNFHVSLRTLCGGSYWYSDVSTNGPAPITGNSFTIDVDDGIASYTYNGYFISSTVCTGRYSFFADCGGSYSFGSGNWTTEKVGNDPVLYRNPSSRNFGTLQVGTSTDLTFTVGNVGGGTLNGTASGLSSPFSIVSGSPYSLGSFVYTSITVRFSPASAGAWTQTVTFTGGAGATAQVSGSATAANVAPTNIIISSTNIAENSSIGTKVGHFTTQDPDAGNTFVYALTNGTGGTDNGSFTISGSNLLTAAMFNYEIKSNYSIRIQSTDQGLLFTQKVFAINVVDVDEIPVFYGPTEPTNGNMVLRWSSVTTHLYTVYYSTNLLAGFLVLQSNIPATPVINSYTQSVLTVPQKFWKITTDP